MPNKHGLSRHIPAEVRAEIRRRSKNGCVICRALVYDYEHIEPEFADALVHNPSNICLLCPQHHAEVTRGRIAKSQVRAAYDAVQVSSEIRPPFFHTQLSGGLELGLGNALFSSMPRDACLLKYDDEKILKVGFVEDEVFGGSRPSISGTVYGIEGTALIGFDDNRITLLVEGVDVLFEGDALKVREPSGTLALKITFAPPNGIRLDCLRMRYEDLICELDDTFGVTFPTLSGDHHSCLVSGINVQGAHSAISYTSNQRHWHRSQDLSVVGGRGILIPYSGVTIAAGAGRMLLPRLEYIL